jgi:hypothetical protein
MIFLLPKHTLTSAAYGDLYVDHSDDGHSLCATCRHFVTLDEVHATAVLYSQQAVYNPRQRWYYLKDQESTEVLIFKSMDSEIRGEGVYGFCPDPPSTRWLIF